MASREKDQADFDLEQFVDLFDTAMSSDNPAVQRALKNLLLIAAMVNAEDAEAGMRQGPLRRVLEDQKTIIRRLNDLEQNNSHWNRTYGPITPGTPSMPSPGTPFGPVPLGPYVGSPLTWPTTGTGMPPPNQIWCTTNTNISSSAVDDQFISDNSQKYATLLDKLETRN